ncbi:hypothetical protein C1646_753977 [Rhizophagus diaphanus]|nr:hypothetical protein C1646_753977 [Rhizophagus diaphanus] [Rhizophagus sp. MUCL 43196]
MFYDYCYEIYGNIHEIYDSDRSIVLCRKEYLENFLCLSEKNAHWMRYNNSIKPEEFGTVGKGILFNNNFKSWIFNRQFFSQAILSPKFTDEVIDCTNKLFDELESYWNKLFLKKLLKKIDLLTGEKSYSMAAYFTTLGDEKSQSAMINDSRRRNEIYNTSLDESLPHDMLTSMIIKNTPRDDNYFETGEANRSMTDSEIRANLLEGIIAGTYKARESLI